MTAPSPAPLHGATIIDAIKAADTRHVIALPDIVTCEGVLWPMTHDPDLRVVTVCKEDEGVSICAAMSYADERAVLLIQHTGFLDSINAIRAIAVEYSLPVVMIVGLQGMEPDRLPSESGKYGIQIMEPLLNAMDLDYAIVCEDSDAAAMDGDNRQRLRLVEAVCLRRRPQPPPQPLEAGVKP